MIHSMIAWNFLTLTASFSMGFSKILIGPLLLGLGGDKVLQGKGSLLPIKWTP